jgi:hypothetical protein
VIPYLSVRSLSHGPTVVPSIEVGSGRLGALAESLGTRNLK